MLCSFKSKLRSWMFQICSPFETLHFWAASNNLYGILAVSPRYSPLGSRFARREVCRDWKSIPMTENLSGSRSGALIGQRSSYIVLAIAYKWPTKTKGHEGQRKTRWITTKQLILVEYILPYKKHLSFAEARSQKNPKLYHNRSGETKSNNCSFGTP